MQEIKINDEIGEVAEYNEKIMFESLNKKDVDHVDVFHLTEKDAEEIRAVKSKHEREILFRSFRNQNKKRR